MKKVRVEREVWQAKDGVEFQTEDGCREYELGLLKPEFYDLNCPNDLAVFLRENKEELFRVMGWETPVDVDHPLLRPVSVSGDMSGLTFYQYELSSGSRRGYSGTLYVQSGDGLGGGYDLGDIDKLTLEIMEVKCG